MRRGVGVLLYVGRQRTQRGQTKEEVTAMAERKPVTNGSNAAVLNRPLTEDVDSLNGTGTGTDAYTGTTNDGGESEGESEVAATKAPKRNLDDAPDDEVVGITMRVPNAFRKLLAKTAVDQKTSVPQMLAQMAAEAFNYTLPEPERAPRLKKYDSPEERKKAQVKDQQRQRLIARKALEAVEKGNLQVDMVALMAEVDAELAANAAKAEARAAEDADNAPATTPEDATTDTTTDGATS